MMHSIRYSWASESLQFTTCSRTPGRTICGEKKAQEKWFDWTNYHKHNNSMYVSMYGINTCQMQQTRRWNITIQCQKNHQCSRIRHCAVLVSGVSLLPKCYPALWKLKVRSGVTSKSILGWIKGQYGMTTLTLRTDVQHSFIRCA